VIPYDDLISEFANLETPCIESVPNYCIVGFDNLSVLNFEAFEKSDTNYQKP
jgi:hypothetical protein